MQGEHSMSVHEPTILKMPRSFADEPPSPGEIVTLVRGGPEHRAVQEYVKKAYDAGYAAGYAAGRAYTAELHEVGSQ